MKPEDIVVALSLYQYNVGADERARLLHEHFNGECLDIDDLVRILDTPYWATALPYPTVLVYVAQGIAKYGDEARERNMVNSRGLGQV